MVEAYFRGPNRGVAGGVVRLICSNISLGFQFLQPTWICESVQKGS
jgi:hypothetical protein